MLSKLGFTEKLHLVKGELVNKELSMLAAWEILIIAFYITEPQISRSLSDPFFVTVHKFPILFSDKKVVQPWRELGNRDSQTGAPQGRAWAPGTVILVLLPSDSTSPAKVPRQ